MALETSVNFMPEVSTGTGIASVSGTCIKKTENFLSDIPIEQNTTSVLKMPITPLNDIPETPIDQINLHAFKGLLLDTCGFAFTNEREQTLYDGLHNRMKCLKITSYIDYHNLLLRKPSEMELLVELLTVNETYFLREPEQLCLMIDRLIPEIRYLKGKEYRIRIVSAGCSTGEEPYSIAMMLHERYGQESQHLFEIIGADIDASAISCAIRGEYSRYSFRTLERSLLDRYFEPVGKTNSVTFQIVPSIRKLVRFQVVNLNAATYPDAMCYPDIIFYRNVSIYFQDHVQQAIFARLATILNAGGYLLVSSTETLHHNTGILSLVAMNDLFVYKKCTISKERQSTIKDKRQGKVNSICHGKYPLENYYQKQHAVHKCTQNRHVEHTYTHEPKAATPDRSSKFFPEKTWGKIEWRNRDKKTALLKKNPGVQYQESYDAGKAFDNALEHLKSDRIEDATITLKAIIENKPDFIKAYLLLATICIDAQRMADAESACKSVLAFEPFCLEACLALGIIAYHRGKYEDGLKRLREAIYINSNCWPAHFYLAEVAINLGEKRRALSAYQSALDILNKGKLSEHGNTFSPLRFNAEQVLTVCRHKLNLLHRAE